jgi:5,5'-dehydrodivanillate O-demethylase
MQATDAPDFTRTGPDTLAGRYLRRFWQPVYLAEDLVPGRAKPVRIASEDFTLYRGEGGAVHALAFRCAHRGTQLSTGWVEGDCLRCFYHGWKYDGSGQCVEMPAEDPSFPPKVRIRSYPTEEYLGLIFAYLGDGEPPPLPRFPEMEDETEAVREVYTYTWPCNFFQALENDPFHGIWVHRESYEAAGRVGVPQVTCEETEYGFVTYARRPQATKWTQSASYFHMPNSEHSTRTAPELGREGWRDAIAWRVPVDDGHVVSFGVNLSHVTGEARQRYEEAQRARRERLKDLVPAPVLAEAVLRGELQISDIADRHVDPGRLFNLQDYVAQVGQGTIVDYSRQRLGREDVTVIMLRKLWQRELRALAEGRPLKEWSRPEAQLDVRHSR